MKKSILPVVIVLALLAVIGVTLANNKKKIEANKKVVDRSGIPIAVSTAIAGFSEAKGSLNLPALLEAEAEADISPAVAGRIQHLDIQLGTRVRKGQIVGTVDTRLKELSLKATQLSIDKLEKDYKRTQDLYAGSAATEASLSDIRFNFENIKAQADQIRQQITDAGIVAPIDGIVTAKNMEAGEFANPGNVIATVVNVNTLKAVVYVNEKDAYRLTEGQSTTIQSDVYAGRSFRGTVTFISPKADENHNYRVEVQVENDSRAALKAGTYARIAFNLHQTGKALQIPKNALAEGTKNSFIFIVKDGRAQQRKVVLGREVGENIEIVSGLHEGEVVVVSGQINLVEGSKVSISHN